MALTGVLKADFSEFTTATAKAEAQLQSLSAGAGKVGTSLDGVNAAAKRSTGPVTDLGGAFRQFDGVLASAGVHIGPEIRGLSELGNAAGKTAGELGKLATAGLTIGAALGGWKIGRLVSEFFGLDEAIGKATAKLMGWGDLTGQVAGAQQDVITRAIERGAAATISYSAALQFNTDWLKKHRDAATTAAKAGEDWAAAMVEINAAGVGWKGTLLTINGATVEAIKYYLQAGISQGVLAKAYGLTDVQIKSVASSMAAFAKEEEKAAAAAKVLADIYTKHWNEVGDVLDTVFGTASLKKATTWVDAIDSLGGSIAQLSNTELVDLEAAMLAGIDSLARSGQLTSEQSSRFAELAVQARIATDAIKVLVSDDVALRQALYDEAVAQDRANAGLAQVPGLAAAASGAIAGVTQSYWGAVDAALALESARAAAMGGSTTSVGTRPPGLDSPGWPSGSSGGGHGTGWPSGGIDPNLGTGQWGRKAPDLFAPSVSRATPNVAITINGSVLGNKDEIARVVGDAVSRSLLRGGPVRSA